MEHDNPNKSPHIAVVGFCPVCGQGRQFVARDTLTRGLFVYCEECESEWESPVNACRVDLAKHGKHESSSLVDIDALNGHEWLALVINNDA